MFPLSFAIPTARFGSGNLLTKKNLRNLSNLRILTWLSGLFAKPLDRPLQPG
jgi:hypothetical protein